MHAPINPDHSSFNFCRHDVSTGNVFCEDGGTEAVAGVIGSLDGLRLRREFVYADEGTEDFFFADGVVILTKNLSL
jgi:hypothetical protein